VPDQDVALTRAGVRDRLAGADRHEPQVVLREAPLELRRDQLVEHAGVPHARRALHDQRPLLLLCRGGAGAHERDCLGIG